MATLTELYRFNEQGSDEVWTYTSGDEEITYDAGEGDETYAPISISRTGVETKNEMARANIDVKLSLTNPAAIRWLSDNGEKIVSLTIFERRRSGAFAVVWKGRLAGIIPELDAIKLRMESIFTSLRRPGLRARYQRSCRHALYGRGCTLDAEAFAIAGTLTALDGATAIVSGAEAFADGYLTGGMLRSPDGVLSYIVNHTGSTILLQRASFSLITAVEGGLPVAVTLYPGCSHDRATCATKFDNLLNYGGFDFIPQKNPMGGSSIV